MTAIWACGTLEKVALGAHPAGEEVMWMLLGTREPRVVDDAIRVIQTHLDKEARNRRQVVLSPRELCPMQKAELIEDLVALLR